MLLSVASFSNATEGVLENNVSIVGWKTSHETEIPILRFDTNLLVNPILDDIKSENIIQDKDGSVRFKLSRTTPFGRQAFANVITTDLGNGTTKNIMTNIADGKQTTFISRNNELASDARTLTLGDQSVQLLQSKGGDDASIQAWPLGVAFLCAAGILVAEISCTRLCGDRGVDELSYGICGVNPVCTCN
ncbi:MAG: hypothetical protein L3J22_09820 [Xanthomonadales bacterium]|nr:hypothetical protein [Xanthomonadales bacterium]